MLFKRQSKKYEIGENDAPISYLQDLAIAIVRVKSMIQ